MTRKLPKVLVNFTTSIFPMVTKKKTNTKSKKVQPKTKTTTKAKVKKPALKKAPIKKSISKRKT